MDETSTFILVYPNYESNYTVIVISKIFLDNKRLSQIRPIILLE